MSEFLIPILHQLPETSEPFTTASLMPESEAPTLPVPDTSATVLTTQIVAPEVRAESLAEIESAKATAYEKAYAEGLAQGREEGLKQAATDMQKSLALLEEAEASFKAQYQQWLAGMDSLIPAIVFEAVLKIVGSEIQQPGQRAQIIQQVVAQYASHPILQILVNPADIAALKQCLQGDISQDAMQALLSPDNKVAIGSCRIVFKDAIVNTDLQTQLQAFASHLSAHAQTK